MDTVVQLSGPKAAIDWKVCLAAIFWGGGGGNWNGFISQNRTESPPHPTHKHQILNAAFLD